MSWAKIDDMFSQHPKLIQAGAVAWGMWAEGIAYCNRNLTDGFIPESAAEAFGGRWRVRQGGKTWEIFARCGDEVVTVTADWIAVALVDAGLWHAVEGGYQVHDYLDYQPSRAQVLAKREELSATRREAGAAGGRAKAANARQPASNGHGKEASNVPSKSPSKTLAKGYQKRSPMPVPVPVTTDAADAAATRADAPAPAAPARTRGTKQQASSSSTNTPDAIQPHPTPVKIPKPPEEGDTSIPSRAEAIVASHPAAEQLRPLAEIAIEVTGIDVSVFTLEQWHRSGYPLEMVRAGCAFAVQKHAGRAVPEGYVINTATRWMQRSRPEEYAASTPIQPIARRDDPPPRPKLTPEDDLALRMENIAILEAAGL